VSRGDPIGLGIGSFAHGDLEVGVHSVVDIPIRGPLVGLGIPLNSRLEPFDLVFKGEDCEAMDFLAILDGLDQTGGNFLEGNCVDIGIGGEYVLHSMGQVT